MTFQAEDIVVWRKRQRGTVIPAEVQARVIIRTAKRITIHIEGAKESAGPAVRHVAAGSLRLVGRCPDCRRTIGEAVQTGFWDGFGMAGGGVFSATCPGCGAGLEAMATYDKPPGEMVWDRVRAELGAEPDRGGTVAF